MANQTSTLIVRMLDQVSAPASVAAGSLNRLQAAITRLGTAGGLSGAMSGLSRGLNHANVGLTALAQRIEGVRRALGGLQLPAGFAAMWTAHSIYQIERAGNRIEAFVQATREQRRELERLAQSLDAQFSFSLPKIMETMVELGKQGITPQNIPSLLSSVLRVAQATDIDPNEAASYILGGVRGMRLADPDKDAPQRVEAQARRVGDLLTAIANLSSLDIRGAAEIFRYAGSAGSAIGLTPEQIAAMGIVMGNANIPGSEIGVALRSMIVSLVRGGRQQQEAFARLGIDRSEFIRGGRQATADDVIRHLQLAGIDATGLRDQIGAALADPALRGDMPALIARLTDAVQGAGLGGAMDRNALADAMRDAVQASGMDIDLFGLLRRISERGGTHELVRIFEGRQFSRNLILAMSNLSEALKKVETEAAGSAQRAAERMLQGLPKAWEEFGAAASRLAKAIGDSGITDMMISALNALTTAFNRLAELDPAKLQALALGIAGLGSGVVLAGVAGLARLTAAIIRLGAAATGAATAVSAASAASAGAAGAGIGALLRRGLARLGIAGATLGILSLTDRDGNLWGMTSSLDRWIWEHFGINPADPSGGPPSGAGTRFTLEELNERLRVRPLTGPSPDATASGIAPSQEAARAAEALGALIGGRMLSSVQDAVSETAPNVARQIAEVFNAIVLRPRVVPQVDLSGLNGVHGDIGVAPQR